MATVHWFSYGNIWASEYKVLFIFIRQYPHMSNPHGRCLKLVWIEDIHLYFFKEFILVKGGLDIYSLEL